MKIILKKRLKEIISWSRDVGGADLLQEFEPTPTASIF